MKQSKIISTIAKNWDKAREEKRKSNRVVQSTTQYFRTIDGDTIMTSRHYFTIKI
jgi:hypothetical protein